MPIDPQTDDDRSGLRSVRRRHGVATLLVLAALLAVPVAFAGETAPAPSRASLPLEEVLKLHRELDETRRKPAETPPPVAAAVSRLELTGRLLDDAVDLTARFEVTVLESDTWIDLPLLPSDPSMHLSSLPQVEGGFLIEERGYLRFVGRKPGTYRFEIGLLAQAALDGRRRRVELDYAAATLATATLAFDEGLFRVAGARSVEGAEGALLYPDDHRFTFDWERATDAVEAPRRRVERPTIESAVPVAHVSAVSTLEGRRLVRLRYELRFAGTETIELDLPAGLTLERAYLNGNGVPAATEEGHVALDVAPAREGDQAAVLELVLSGEQPGYLLSGVFELHLPRVSWPLHDLFAEVHLPQVFNYEWSGGSLAPVDTVPAASYTYDLPLPGKALRFHQQLISSSEPTLTLNYAVDLQGHYFRP